MKDSLLIYTAYSDKFAKLSDAQFGQLMRAVLEYQATDTAPEIDDLAVSMAFDVIKFDLDKNNEKYAEVVEKRKVAGRKGGEAKQANASKAKQKLAKASKAKQSLANLADNDNDNVNDNDNENVNENDNDMCIGGKPLHTHHRFQPPCIAEVQAYCNERGNGIDAQYFLDYYTARNWELGKGRKVKDWKACVRTWEKNGFSKGRAQPVSTSSLIDKWMGA